MLHIVNKSPFHTNSLGSCLRMAQAGSALLLIEDGVYAAAIGTAAESRIQQAMTSLKVYALKPDVDARGLGGKLAQGIELVDYGGFVDLTLEYTTVQSWL
jgi:tRNA 2-thiouridine synthesizing protein B